MESHRLAPYSDEGPSNYHLNSAYGYAAASSDPAVRHISDRVEHLEQDRAQLLKKLDELRDQLRQSCEVADKKKNGELPYKDDGHSTFYPERLSSPTMHAASSIPGSREVPGAQLLGKAPFHPQGQYPQMPLNNYRYNQFNPNPVVSYRHHGFYHQPACSCPHCYNGHWLPPAHSPHPVYSNTQRIPPLGTTDGLYQPDASSMLGLQSYHEIVSDASLQPRELHHSLQSDEFRASLLSHEVHAQLRHTFPKEGLSYRPLAGAAPFIVCHNCHKLLQVPEDISLVKKKHSKLRCRSCSHVIVLKLDGRRLVASLPVLHETSKNHDGSLGGTKVDLQSNDRVITQLVSSQSGDYVIPAYDFHSTDENLVMPSAAPDATQEMVGQESGLHLSELERKQELSFSSTSSEYLEISYGRNSQKELPSSGKHPLEDEATSNVASLPLREFPPSNEVIDISGEGSRSKHSKEEKIVSLDADLKQNSLENVIVKAGENSSVDEIPKLLQVSWEVGSDEEEPVISKGRESFFAGLIKKHFKEKSRINQPVEIGKSRVSINGHPISDRKLKKAERLAGPIHPGAYWYDYRAGFWGVMGHRCLGIIPPFIEEFNYPMPKNCAGGNTGVVINGRELNKKELNLLTSRGLPATEGSYIMEISGKVWDEASGKELDSLGKLAPTIEKVKHGFGMRTPRAGDSMQSSNHAQSFQSLLT